MKNMIHQKEKKKIGIITGSGPEAGIDLWMKILAANKEYVGDKFKGDIETPHIVIHSVPELGYSMDIEKNDKILRESLLEAIKRISKDVDFFCIACNTLHYYRKYIEQLTSTAEFVSIVDVVTNYIKLHGIKRLALMGTKSVMNLGNGIYSHLSDLTEVEIPVDLNKMHQLVFDIKRLGADNEPVKNKFLVIVNQFNSKDILLACTELPLIKLELPDINLIDSTYLMAKVLVRKVYSTD